MLQGANDILKVKYFHEPVPLYERLSNDFSYESQELESGDFLVIFKKK